MDSENRSLRHDVRRNIARADEIVGANDVNLPSYYHAMTRRYYHENEDALRRAVESVPSMAAIKPGCKPSDRTTAAEPQPCRGSQFGTRIPQRLKRLDRLFKDARRAEDVAPYLRDGDDPSDGDGFRVVGASVPARPHSPQGLPPPPPKKSPTVITGGEIPVREIMQSIWVRPFREYPCR